ncbi:MAG: beta-propeller fold lactonase family protein [Deltaproteobacteria bacterium]|nr:beta-propeller fold lactonase family protein [Deltaproteobacteria bacterium]
MIVSKRKIGSPFILVCLSLILPCFLFAADSVNSKGQGKGKKAPQLTRTLIGDKTERVIIDKESGKKRKLSVELIGRFQHYNSRPAHNSDHYDKHVFSPKSVHFQSSGNKVYVNALEGLATIAYDYNKLEKLSAIKHRFKKEDASLFEAIREDKPVSFHGNNGNISNVFWGKPVEFAETHKGRYIWVTYYRRSYDANASLPSAVAVIDSLTDSIVRVMPAGAIPKSIAASPDGKRVAIINWGENSVGIVNVSTESPADYHYEKLIEIEKKYVVKGDKHLNRDSACGYCLRGGVFTPDSKYLLVGRMKGGGIAVIDMEKLQYMGTVFGMKPTPRHMVLSPHGETLYLSSNISGYVSSFRLNDIVEAVIKGRRSIKALHEVRTGVGTRTIQVSPDGSLIFAAIKYESRIAVIRTDTMELVMKVPTDSYPVGLDVSPEGDQVWVTAQGAKGRGGNSVSAYRLSVSEFN